LIIVDANILLYAHDSRSPRYERARAWLEDVMNGEEEVGLSLATLLAFLRVGTNPSLFPNPLTSDEAISVVTTWLDLQSVRLVQPTDLHWSTLEEVCRAGQARGPLLMDAHLAALALEHGATLCTTDRDFARFPRLKIFNPLAA
jgi:toxin-antitoxin system PIN domain toxin